MSALDGPDAALNTLVGELRHQIAVLQRALAERDETIADRDARIAELEGGDKAPDGPGAPQ